MPNLEISARIDICVLKKQVNGQMREFFLGHQGCNKKFKLQHIIFISTRSSQTSSALAKGVGQIGTLIIRTNRAEVSSVPLKLGFSCMRWFLVSTYPKG